MDRGKMRQALRNAFSPLAHLLGFSSVFGGGVPGTQTAPAEISSSILVQRLPIEWKRRYNGRGHVFRDQIV
jgi:hypothetical protein